MGIIFKLFYLILKNFGCCVKQRQAEFNCSQTNVVLLSTFNILYIIVGVKKQIFACDWPLEDALFLPNHDTCQLFHKSTNIITYFNNKSMMLI